MTAETMNNDVKDRGLTGAILDELWPILGGSHTAASVWTEIEDALSPVIARHQSQEREAVSRYPSTHLGEQQQPLEDTFSGFQMLRDEAALTTPAPAAQPEREDVSVEEAAQRIFEHYAFGTWVPGEKPAWVPNGNSRMQDLARSFARAALKTTHAPTSEREAVLEEVVRTFAEGLWAEARKRGEMRPEFMPSSRTDFLDEARKQLTALKTTPAPAVKPHCSTCGKDVAEVLCETCGKWWADNPPPAPAAEREAVLDEVNIERRLRERVARIRGYIESSERVVELLKPEMAKFDARDAPWDTYTVRLSVDHSSSIRTQMKEAEELEQAADELARLRAENEALREAVRMALTCTPSARNGEVIYDCGNPWEILSTALKGSRHE